MNLQPYNDLVKEPITVDHISFNPIGLNTYKRQVTHKLFHLHIFKSYEYNQTFATTVNTSLWLNTYTQ